ncbi:MAG: hypothetical protein M3P50_09090 [Actinomycetota bacterium]|nr:hypothetical protein [Actinomycetota bacterium]
MASAGPSGRTRALLEIVRPHVDEIVLAVDAGAGRDTLEICRDLADRRISFSQDRPSSASLWGWLFEQASADWVMRLDDDEVPSLALLDALPELLADRRLSQYRLRRRWVWPDAGTLLDEPPWSIEYIPRLTRTIHGLVSYTGPRHSDETAIGESRMVDAPFYHLDLVARDAESRRRKVLLHEEDNPGLVFAGMSVNAPYYPEAGEDLVTVRVPSEDAPAIRALLDGAPERAAGDEELAPVEYVGADEVRVPILMRPVNPEAHAGEVVMPDPPFSVRAGILHHLLVVVRNLGDERWPAGDRPERPIRLGYRWRKAGDPGVAFEGRNAFLETILPGMEARHHLAVNVPPEPGRYRLEVGLIHEHVRWFGTEAAHDLEVTAPGAEIDPLLAYQRENSLARAAARLEGEVEQLRAELERPQPIDPRLVGELAELRAALERERRRHAEELERLQGAAPGAGPLRADLVIADLQERLGELDAENARLRLEAAGDGRAD